MSKPFRILSLSGGGIRGIYQAYFLKKLEQRLGSPLDNHFDLICGTSTGAIVGLAIAAKIDLAKIINLYKEKGNDIFKKKFLGPLRRGPIYYNTNLRKHLLDTFGNLKLQDIDKKVLITAASINKVKHRVFSNMNDEDPFDLNLPLVDVILSTTAAPTFFSPYKPTEGEQVYVDGGLWANSPAQVGINYAHKYLGVSYEKIHMVSIGTSKSDDGITLEKFNQMRQLSFSTPKTIIDLFFSTQESYAQKFCMDLLGEERFLKVNSHTKEYIALDDVFNALNQLPALAEQKLEEYYDKLKKLIVFDNHGSSQHEYVVRRGKLISDYLIEETGLSGFYPTRDHYKVRGTSGTLEMYISSAKEDITFVSISLIKGINFDDLRTVLDRKIKQEGKDFKVTISLLNPYKDFLMESLAAVFEKDKALIVSDIQDTVRKLVLFKNNLPKKKKKNLNLRYHNAIPFGSAIMFDKNTQNAKIQIETKPYKSPHGKSFAFEIVPVSGDGFFSTLKKAYEDIISDGENMY